MGLVVRTMLATIVAGVVTLSQAQVGQQGHHRGMMDGGMMRGGMMGGDSTGMMPMMGCGMGMMMPKQIVPVDDGIIVVMGNKLVKYDADLKKKKEVTLELDEEAMKAMLEHMREMHSMMRGTMLSPQGDKEGK